MAQKNVLQSERLKKIGVNHGFFTRANGIFPPEIIGNVRQNELDPKVKTRIAFFLKNLEAKTLALPRQVHSDEIWEAPVESEFPVIRGTESDAAISRSKRMAVGVVTADCIPILLALKDRKTVAAVHAGWRGLYSEILVKAVERINAINGNSPDEMVAAIGPAIGKCCYEVDDVLARKFLSKFNWAEKFITLMEKKKFHIDLSGIAKEQLSRAGIQIDDIDTIALCTKCNFQLFYSYRGDGEGAARQLSAAVPMSPK